MRQPLEISPAGLSLLKAYEKFSLDVYADQANRPTIYWGHLIRAGERFNRSRIGRAAFQPATATCAKTCTA